MSLLTDAVATKGYDSKLLTHIKNFVELNPSISEEAMGKLKAQYIQSMKEPEAAQPSPAYAALAWPTTGSISYGEPPTVTKMLPVTITKASNAGFLMQIGHLTLVYTNAMAMSDDLLEYVANPPGFTQKHDGTGKLEGALWADTNGAQHISGAPTGSGSGTYGDLTVSTNSFWKSMTPPADASNSLTKSQVGDLKKDLDKKLIKASYGQELAYKGLPIGQFWDSDDPTEKFDNSPALAQLTKPPMPNENFVFEPVKT